MSARRDVAWFDPAAAETLGRLAAAEVPESWQDRALCAQADPEAWFPERGVCPRAAKALCASCPVADECLAYALDHMTGIYDVGQYGIWGGTSPEERHDLKRGLADAA